ncbi:MAG: DUF4830 domain-containing protein [Ruminococcus sp.]|nr:DUF4830 domain-containing protein [Ruminococcus sp.]
MVVFTFGKKRAARAAVISALAVVLIVLCVAIAAGGRASVPDFATADEVGKYSTAAGDTKAQVKFLSQFGIKIDKNTKKTDTVTIPESFNAVYEDYNNLQIEAGLDLKPFRGEQVSRVVYKINKKEGYATLLLFKGRVIGGHLSTGEYGDGYEALNYGTIG